MRNDCVNLILFLSRITSRGRPAVCGTRCAHLPADGRTKPQHVAPQCQAGLPRPRKKVKSQVRMAYSYFHAWWRSLLVSSVWKTCLKVTYLSVCRGCCVAPEEEVSTRNQGPNGYSQVPEDHQLVTQEKPLCTPCKFSSALCIWVSLDLICGLI